MLFFGIKKPRVPSILLFAVENHSTFNMGHSVKGTLNITERQLKANKTPHKSINVSFNFTEIFR